MNKKFVRAFALVLAALMCLSLLPLAARADEGHVCQFTPVRTEPTCGEEGYVQMTCEVCGNAGEIIEWIPPTGAHTFMDVLNDDYLFEESDNLCLRPARYWKSCAVCGAAAEEAHTEALNKLYEEINQRKNNGEEHTNEEWQKITEDAVKEVDAQYTFSFGGEGHSWVSYERQEATCTSDGWEAYRQCSACGAIDGEYPRIPAKGHRWGEFTVTKEPTCTEDGSKERVCEVCGEKETVAIPALGHTWGAFTVITEPKCEEDGLQEHICEVCEATESVAIPALGHRWGAFTVTRPATCTVDGEQEHTCAACGKKETEIIPAGHKWGEWVVTVEPGCYSSGERTRTCTVCGEKETEAIAPAHKFGEWVVVMEPTCYSTGEERSTCTVCGETESRWLDMAHKYENGVCVFCGEAQPDAPAVTGTEEPAAEAEETGTEENNTEEHTNDTNETPANEPEAEGEPAADVPYTGIQNADAVKNGEIVDEAYVGNVLTAAVTPADHEYIYQWYRIAGEEIEEIPGAYDKSYRLTEEDVGASVYCFVDDEEMSDATTYAVAVLPADQDPNPAPAEEAEKSNTLEEAETFAAAEPTVTMENSSAETIADFAEKTGIATDPASITAQNVTPVGANGEKLDNDAVAAAGGVTFEMPLPENYKSGDDIEIYHQNSETGAWEKITNYTVIDGKVIIREQKDFSAFIVVDKNGNLVEAETFAAADKIVVAKSESTDVYNTDFEGFIDEQGFSDDSTHYVIYDVELAWSDDSTDPVEEIPTDGVTFELGLPADYNSETDVVRVYHYSSDSWGAVDNYDVNDATGKVRINKYKEFSPFAVLSFPRSLLPTAEDTPRFSTPKLLDKDGKEVNEILTGETLTVYVEPNNIPYEYQWVIEEDGVPKLTTATYRSVVVGESLCPYTLYCSVNERDIPDPALLTNGVHVRMKIPFPTEIKGEGYVVITDTDMINQDREARTFNYPAEQSRTFSIDSLTENKVTIFADPASAKGYYVRSVKIGTTTVISASTEARSYTINSVVKERKDDNIEIFFDKAVCKAELTPTQEPDIRYAGDPNIKQSFLDAYVKNSEPYKYYYVTPHWSTAPAKPLMESEITAIGGFTFPMDVPEGVTPDTKNDYDIRVYHYIQDPSSKTYSWSEIEAFSIITVTEDGVEKLKIQVENCSQFSPFAVVARPTFKCTFKNGDHGRVNNEDIVADDAGKVLLPQPVLTDVDSGYTFLGWKWTDDKGKEKTSQPGDYITIKKNTDVTAVWVTGFTITFDDNDNDNRDTYGALVEGEMDPQYIYTDFQGHYYDKDGSLLTSVPRLNNRQFSLSNHTFKGWNTVGGPDNKPAIYTNQNIIDDSEKPEGERNPITGNIILHAVWQKEQSTIHFNANGGSGGMSDQSSGIGSSIDIKSIYYKDTDGKTKQYISPPLSDQLFGGWSKNTPSGNIDYKNGATIIMPEDDMTLYAVWRDKVIIHFSPESTSSEYGGTGKVDPDNPMVNQAVASGAEMTLQGNKYKAPAGKAFAFWSDKQDGTGNRFLDKSTHAWTGDTYLYAQWGNEITVTYLPNGGEGATKKEQSVAEEVDTTLYTFGETGFYRKDYKFLGWDPIATKKDNPLYQAGETVEGGFNKDTTLYAIWEQTDFVGTVLVTGSQSGIDPVGYWEETLTCEVAGEPKYMIAGYQWRRDGENIDGATSDKYVPNVEDYGKTITCAVKAYDPDDPYVDPDAEEKEWKYLKPYPESNPKHIITQEIEVKEIHDDGLTLSAYKYGLMPNMTYTLNGIDQGKVILDSQNRMAFTKGGTYKFFDKDGKMVSIVEVENWYTLSYTVTNRTTTNTNSNTGSANKNTTSTTTSTGGGTVRMYNGSTQLTSAAVKDPNTDEIIIKSNGSITTSSGSWLVREGANTDLKMVVAPSSNSFAYVNLNGSSYQSLGSGEKTVTVSPMNTYKHYEIVFANATSSPKTADESHLGMWSALCFTSLVASSAVLTRSRRRRKNEK